MLAIAVIAAMAAPLWSAALEAVPKARNRAVPQQRGLQAPRVRAVPTISSHARAAGNRVVLERADRLMKTEHDSFMVVSGNVKFVKGPMLMFCDSAHYYNADGSLDAFGNVRMQQGDTLFVYADELNYNGRSEIAYLYGYTPQTPVRMINRDVKLTTDVFTYDMLIDIGFYNTGGTLTDKRNKLTSIEGEYIPATKDANFYDRVHLTSLRTNDTLDIYTDTLLYNTASHMAEFLSPTRIINGQGTIYSTEGTYNTDNSVANLYQRSRVVTRRGTTLEGDTLFYDRTNGRGEARGNMVLVDSARQATLSGNYGFYNEITDSAFVTGHALAMEYSREDTLYMHGRYITSVLRVDSVLGKDSVMAPDSTHIMTAWPRVRFYRTDMQGLCDSMQFVQRDSMLHLFRHPVVWNGERQVFGNLISVQLNDSTVERALLPDFGFTAQELEPDYYNQLSGKKMELFFERGEARRLEVSGSVEAIFFPEENDSTINKMVSVQSSFMTAWLLPQGVERMKMWPQTTGQATPLFLARKDQLLLPRFKWYAPLRPTNPASVFIIPPEMEELMNQAVSE